MNNEYSPQYNEKLSVKIYHFIQDIWPVIYRTLNDLFFGFLNFLKDTLSGLWRRY